MKDYQLIEIACKAGKVSIKSIAFDSRIQNVTDARHLAFYILHKHTRLTHERIAMLFNVGKGSIYYGLQKIETELDFFEMSGITSHLTEIYFKSKVETTKLIQDENYHMGTVTPSNDLPDWNSNLIFDTVAVNS